jgi:hypothetical protein
MKPIMKILICTPAFGGMNSIEYTLSLVQTIAGFRQDNVDYSLYMMGNESLISRGRNKCAFTALNSHTGPYQKLLFIDADIGWTYAQLRQLIFSDKRIIGGTYPMKTTPIALNFNPLMEHLRYFSHRKSVAEFNKYKKEQANEKGEVEVMHIPTGFLMIDTEVFRELASKVPTYSGHDLSTGTTASYHDFFPVRVKNGILESEDWAFCSLARDNGIKIWFQTNIVTTHTGTFTWDVPAKDLA